MVLPLLIYKEVDTKRGSNALHHGFLKKKQHITISPPPPTHTQTMNLSSQAGVLRRGVINSLVAFSIIVGFIILFYQGQKLQLVPMAVKHKHQEMQAKMAAEHHEQLRGELSVPDPSREECNWSTGRWVYDNVSRPLYNGLKCAFIFSEVACDKYGRKDVMYQQWRWQPHGCDLPRFDAITLLETLRNKRLVFVGDSLNRNQWVSLVCMVEASIPDVRHKMQITNGSLLSFKASEYNATIDFYWSPVLLEYNGDHPTIHQLEYRIIWADRIEKHASAWRDADIISGGLATGVEKRGTNVLMRQNRSTKSDTKETDYSMMEKAKLYFGTLEEKGIHIQILNITELSDYRKDGHPTVFRKQFHPLTKEQIMNPASYADCIHWCLPGVPDVWNEFLYGYLMYK
ncbi:unnamed protein product [Miscanthus lutarioriparius]|uniref:Trichome birefringence-like N-terminal domain-containing protein n=1 Tax=Miscanthus lutarioriparius TaxID=422564 RepID=A0A811RK45_9POAL|nr:unnamed protein product [Miscanthus lutarioriparius]